jgi:UPF0288 family protein (methanogenesis marker protein 3)
MAAPGRKIDQKHLEELINNAGEKLDLPAGQGLRVHIDAKGADLSVLLPFVKRLKRILEEEIKETEINISIGAKAYPPAKNDEKENWKIWINLYKRVEG